MTKPYIDDELALAAENVRNAIETINHSAVWLAERGYSVEITSVPFAYVGGGGFTQFSTEISKKVVI